MLTSGKMIFDLGTGKPQPLGTTSGGII